MVKKPILIIQMQRMGDLILSFPLLLWLTRTFPGHPLWVMVEPQFARPLARLGPAVRYFSPEQAAQIKQEKFFLTINLSHRLESQILAGQVRTENLLGGYTRDHITRINGTWQEYRASLVHNNRHNSFHWADINALDIIPVSTMAGTNWPEPRIQAQTVRKIGLFLGASEADKRPQPKFWAALTQELERRHWTPILLGGPAEKKLGQEVQTLLGRKIASACGTLDLEQFAFLGQTLTAMITPDTGPMHLAAWTGLKVLNLSLGPVSAWETGPFQPGHIILRAARDCVGCWQCRHKHPLCHESFTPGRVAAISDAMLRRNGQGLNRLKPPGLEVLCSARSQVGLYNLQSIWGRQRAGQAVRAYWQEFWLYAFGLGQKESCQQAATNLWAHYPSLAEAMVRASIEFVRALSNSVFDASFFSSQWQKSAPALRPLVGYATTHLSNHDFATPNLRRMLELGEEHLFFLRH